MAVGSAAAVIEVADGLGPALADAAYKDDIASGGHFAAARGEFSGGNAVRGLRPWYQEMFPRFAHVEHAETGGRRGEDSLQFRRADGGGLFLRQRAGKLNVLRRGNRGILAAYRTLRG